jgi:glucose/arabinose dehydrogenase
MEALMTTVSLLRLASTLLLTLLAVPLAAQSPVGDPMAASVDLVAEGLTSPVHLVEPPDGSGRLFVVDQAGLIRIIDSDGRLRRDPFLDLRDRMVALQPFFDERGLLGLAFHPRYGSNGRLFVYYSAPLREGAPEGFNHTSHISAFISSSGSPNQADPESEEILLQVDQPQFNHNAGSLAFGPDGYLYISLGDGGGANDVGLGHVEDWYDGNAGGNGQDLEHNLLGSILRIDVDVPSGYGIPPDNPFVGGSATDDEVFAYGFRNPYRISFDAIGLLVSDAGQALWEEVSLVSAGGNYGWNVKEGTHCFDAENPTVAPAECPDSTPDGMPLIDPVIEYANAQQSGGLGVVVVGGHVYRGDDAPQFRGRYIFGDWSRRFGSPDGSVFVAKPRRKGLWQIQEIIFPDRPGQRLGHYVLGFGRDAGGEIYVLTSDTTGPTGMSGKVYRVGRPGR